MNKTANSLKTLPGHLVYCAAMVAVAGLCFATGLPSHAFARVHSNAPNPARVLVSTHGYTLIPPTGWNKAPQGFAGLDVCYYSASNIRMGAGTSPVDPGVSTATLPATWAATNRAKWDSFRELTQRMTNVGGLPAVNSVELCGAKDIPYPLEAEEYALVRNKLLYEFVYTSPQSHFAVHQAAFDKMVASVRWR